MRKFIDIITEALAEPMSDAPIDGGTSTHYSGTFYHGTTHDFDEFDFTKLVRTGPFGNGIYMSNDLELGQIYSDGATPLSVEVVFNKPYFVDGNVFLSPSRDVLKSKAGKEKLVADGYDGVVFYQKGYREIAAFPSAKLKILGRLDEAPLADFDVMGDRDNEGSFAAQDVKAFTNERWLKKVESHFSRTPYDFHIYLFNAPKGEFTMTYADGSTSTHTGIRNHFDGKLDTPNSLEMFFDMIGRSPPKHPNGITVIMTDNEGSDKIPLTPWILAHRVGHGVLAKPKQMNPPMKLYLATNALLDAIANDGLPYGEVLKFKSAASPDTRVGELSVDLLTQYIVQGGVTIKGDGYAELVQDINDAAKELLDDAVGNYYVVSGRRDTK